MWVGGTRKCPQGGAVPRPDTERVLGSYSLVERIGRGGMAEAWLATLLGARGFEKPLVVKRILPEYARKRSFIEMFVREAKLTAGLQHTNVVQVYELGEQDGEYFLAMEYVDGWDLLRVLRHAAAAGVKVPPPLALYIVSQICRGLAYAHDARGRDGRALGIVHLDVSPSNVLLSRNGAVKLADFGVARARLERGDGSRAQSLRGKIGYMSPEMVCGRDVDKRSDVFAAGIVLYELLTLKRLFRARTALQTLANVRTAALEPRLERHPEIPGAIQEVLRLAVARSPRHRFGTAADMARALDEVSFDAGWRASDRELSSWLEQLFATPARPRERQGSAVTASSSVESTGSWTWGTHRSSSNGTGDAANALRHATFVFRRTSGSGFGPLPFASVLELVGSRSVSADELVSVDGGEWQPLGRVPALADALAEALRSPGIPAIERGELDWQNVAAVLADRVAERFTGLLSVHRAQVRKSLWFVRGRLVHVDSSRKPELLGPHLLAAGLINKVQLEVAFGQAETYGDPIGQALVKLGFLSAGSLFAECRRLLEERAMELVRWQDGEYAVYPEQPLPDGAVPLDVDVVSLLMSAVRRHIPPEALESVLAGLGPKRLEQADPPPPIEVEQLRLNAREYRFWRAIGGPARTAKVLLRDLAPNTEDSAALARVLFLLHQTGHIRACDPLPAAW